MSEEPNFTIQAKKPVPYFLSLVQMSGRILVGGIALTIALLIMISAIGGSSTASKVSVVDKDPFVHAAGKEASENKLLTLDLSGVILGTPPTSDGNPFAFSAPSVTYGYQLHDQILKAAESDKIKGILLHVRTPGGTIFGSQAIHASIKSYQEKTGNPVVAWVEGMSASGGVYATVGADAIYAAPGSVVGSIGVIGAQLVYFDKPMSFTGSVFAGGVETEGGIEVLMPHAGRGKDFGNPYRRPSAEELDKLQKYIESEYRTFVGHVSENRGIPADVISGDMGASVFGNEAAEGYNLIDGTKTRDQAYDALALAAGLEVDDYQIVRNAPPQSDFLSQFMQLSRIAPARDLRAEFIASVAHDRCAVTQQLGLVYFGSLANLCNPMP